MHVTNAHKSRDIWVVRVVAEGVAKKDHGLNLTRRDEAGDLGIATKRPGKLANDL